MSSNTDPQRVELWLTSLEDTIDNGLGETYWQLLGAEEQQRAQRFLCERDRHRYVVARALLRTVLSRVTAISPEDLVFKENRYGKPSLCVRNSGNGGLEFNLSHCDNMIVLALTQGRELGVDIENSAIRPAPLNMARRYFSKEEIDDLDALPVAAQHKRFFEIWALKEAYIKARGMGLSIPLDQFGFRFGIADKLDMWMHPDLEDDPARWHHWQIQIASEYLIALFAEGRSDIPSPQITVTRTVPLVDDNCMEYALLRTPKLHTDFDVGSVTQRPYLTGNVAPVLS